MAKKHSRLMPNLGFVTYLRTSDEEVQSPERSQEAQRRDIYQRLTNAIQLPHLGEYIDNFTGTSADRKQYQHLLNDARQGKFSHVFASVPDRFGRDDVEALRAIDEMTRLGISVRFASHPELDPGDPDDRLYLNILFGMAKRESAVTAQRVRGGMLSKLLDGGWPWKAPDGYINKEMKLNEVGRDEHYKHARYKRWVERHPEQWQVWRYAWDMLLEDGPTFEDICQALSARGYRLQSGVPFMRINRRGKLVPNKQALSRAFHNWFYAGWVVTENEWASIPPKTVRGQWDPIVTTEEFELGLGILARRNHKPTPKKHTFYLLQGMVYLQEEGDRLTKLICSRPNRKRTSNGVTYYCIPSSNFNFPCKDVDNQLPSLLHDIQVEPAVLPRIRQAYLSDVQQYTGKQASEHQVLTEALQRLEDKEVNLWRAFTDHGMRPQVFEKLSREYEQERLRVELALKAIQQENREYIADLDAALDVIAEIGIRYVQQSEQRQRAILRHVVSKVVINVEGTIIRLELQPPFTYLFDLAADETGGKLQTKKKDCGTPRCEDNEADAPNAKCGDNITARSPQVGFCDPNGVWNPGFTHITTTPTTAVTIRIIIVVVQCTAQRHEPIRPGFQPEIHNALCV